MTQIRPAFKFHGGKFYLAPWILSEFPPYHEQLNYVEPFCGGASVFFNKSKPPAFRNVTERLNDLDSPVMSIYLALRDWIKEFIACLDGLEYSAETFYQAQQRDITLNSNVTVLDIAVNEYVLRRMSRGGMKTAFAWSNRLRGGQSGDANAWQTAKLALPSLSQRLQQVELYNLSAIDMITRFDSPETLFYCDPPYLFDTRVSTEVYSFEMSVDQHVQLALTLNECRGKVIISGYPSELYSRQLYRDWNRVEKRIVNHSSQRSVKPIKTEVLWKNF